MGSKYLKTVKPKRRIGYLKRKRRIGVVVRVDGSQSEAQGK